MGPVSLVSLLVAATATNGALLAWSHQDAWPLRPASAWWHVLLLFFFQALWDIILLSILVALLLGLRRLVGTRDRAVDVIRERYARGEIGKAEFDTKLADLKHA